MKKKETNNASNDGRLPPEAEAIQPETRERVRNAIAALERAGAALSVRAVRAAAQVDNHPAGLLLRLHRDGALPPISQPWGRVTAAVVARPAAQAGGQSAPDLVAAVRAARDLESLAAVANEANANLAAGQIDPNTARAIKSLLEEQRQALVAARDAPPAVPTGELLATPDASELVALYEGIVNGKRRAAVVDCARQHALEDARDFPGDSTPERVRERLAELGLDAFGDALNEA